MNKLRYFGILFLFIYILLLSGCVYRPQRTPMIRGFVSKNGEAVEGIIIQYISIKCREDQHKGIIRAKCKSLKDGSFKIIGKKGLGIIIPLPADYIVCWHLCFIEDDSKKICWEVETFGPPDPPEFLEIKCELNSNEICKVISSNDKFFRNLLQK